MADRVVEMVVESVRVHMPSSRHVVILKEVGRERYLPIWIGPWEASAIAMRLQGMAPERPLTHDLIVAVLGALDVEVTGVVIAALADETFHARLRLSSGGRDLELDARPSDAIAIAVRTGATIEAAEAVLDQAGLGADVTADEEEPGAPGHPLEQTGETIVDQRLDVFRDFVNSLDVDPGEGGGASR